LPIELTVCDDYPDQYFIKSKNIGQNISLKDIEIVSTKIESNVPVTKRCTYIYRASDKIDRLDTLQKKNCLYHLYLRFLLNIGDSGLHNILVGKMGEIIGIDFEEQRGNVNIQCAMDALFSRKVSKLQYDYLKEAIYWVDWIENSVFDSDVMIPTDVKEMIMYRNHFMKCLLKYGCI
jgi:hypothetical protein